VPRDHLRLPARSRIRDRRIPPRPALARTTFLRYCANNEGPSSAYRAPWITARHDEINYIKLFRDAGNGIAFHLVSFCNLPSPPFLSPSLRMLPRDCSRCHVRVSLASWRYERTYCLWIRNMRRNSAATIRPCGPIVFPLPGPLARDFSPFPSTGLISDARARARSSAPRLERQEFGGRGRTVGQLPDLHPPANNRVASRRAVMKKYFCSR